MGRRGSPGARRHVVAWLNKAEWDQVLEYLYSKDCKLRRYALHRISAWRSRYGSSMPFAVECTADLVRCKILDVSHGVGSDELVLLYGLALVRFVNLITERKQKTVAIPLRRLANEMNIPEWIVNLRHEITHGKLPKLSWCRKGCEFVLEWLRREYWSRQLGNNFMEPWDSDLEEEESTEEENEEGDEKDLKSPEFYEKVRDVLMSYVEEQFQVLEAVKQISKAKKAWRSPSFEVKTVIARVKDFVKKDSEAVAETLLDNGFLVPTAEQLISLNIKFEESSNLRRVPRAFLRLWQPLLNSLHSQTFTQILLEKLFDDLRGCYEFVTEIRSQYLLYWIFEILSANQRAGMKVKGLTHVRKETRRKCQLFQEQVPLQWSRLLDLCLEAACQVTPHLMQIILLHMEPKLPLNIQKNLLQLCSIYTQGGECLSGLEFSADYREQPIYTVESLRWKARQDSRAKGPGAREESLLKDALEEEQEDDEESVTEQTCREDQLQMLFSAMLDMRKSALEGSAWKINADDVKWSEFPLGTVPGQTEDPGCLLLDSYSVIPEFDQTVTNDGKHPPGTTPSASESNCLASNGLLWTQTDLHRLKAGVRLF
ncbi:ribosomal biogenesis protein LAS1L isoform X2 [Microcaecilia unicolor]|uniref:Ribosomal biogenesis protein LAS1L isoform X2 n=1 Tax=Microcaecilia unicolor TaxID=1415580 RepID=A0A6P7YEM9_9AMPH|nr:ribosomal biogenesis protein LAS1L isoform X2 [Microcaecilia unicolor]